MNYRSCTSMKNKKILLINSYVKDRNVISRMINEFIEEPYPSVGLLYIASTLRQNNYDVFYLDIPVILKQKLIEIDKRHEPSDNCGSYIDNLVEQAIIETYNSYKPDFIGINCLFSGKFSGAIFICSILKKIDRSLPIAIGGIHPTIFHKEILERLNCIDFVIIGEGEESFTRLLDYYFFQKDSLSKIDGLCYRYDGQVITNPKRKFIDNLDTIPIPALDILDMNHYEIEQYKWEKYWHNPRNLKLKYRWPILTSRSCPMNCSFCAMKLVHGKKMRVRSVDNCFSEIEYLYNKYGINYFSIIDDNFTTDKQRIIYLANKIKESNMKIYIDTPNGISVKFFDKDILDALKDMGILRIYLAIESGSDYIRNEIMGKSVSKEKITYISELMRKEKDIFVRAFFIIGMPQETKETLRETYDIIKSLYIDDVSIHYAVPFPGTRLYEDVVANNLLIDPIKDILFDKNFQLSSDIPFIKPYDLEIEELISFKKKVEELFANRYKKLNIERKYPIHHIISI